MSSADLTARARIRDAAIASFADEGFGATMRTIAERAGVSPALVVHHFGTKDGLRSACEEHLLAVVRDDDSLTLAGGDLPRVSARLAENPRLRPLFTFLVRILAEGGPRAKAIFDRMTDDVAGLLAAAERDGNVRPTADAHGRAAVHTGIGLGLLVLDGLLAPALGGETILEPGPAAERYAAHVADLYTHGLLAGDLAAAAQDRADIDDIDDVGGIHDIEEDS